MAAQSQIHMTPAQQLNHYKSENTRPATYLKREPPSIPASSTPCSFTKLTRILPFHESTVTQWVECPCRCTLLTGKLVESLKSVLKHVIAADNLWTQRKVWSIYTKHNELCLFGGGWTVYGLHLRILERYGPDFRRRSHMEYALVSNSVCDTVKKKSAAEQPKR